MSRTVLITGSAGHLGRALRHTFETIGDEVIGMDHVTPAPLESHLVQHVIDLENHGEIDHLFRKRQLPHYDVLIANAKLEGWESHYLLAARAQEAVVYIGSIYGVLGGDPRIYKESEVEETPPWYVAAKGAMVALTRHQAVTLAPKGVRVNCVCPGGIFRGHSPAFEQKYSDRVPLKRMATEFDIVDPVVFLASPGARYITGQVLMVDGGLSAW